LVEHDYVLLTIIYQYDWIHILYKGVFFLIFEVDSFGQFELDILSNVAFTLDPTERKFAIPFPTENETPTPTTTTRKPLSRTRTREVVKKRKSIRSCWSFVGIGR
jgi:hypothetical protein